MSRMEEHPTPILPALTELEENVRHLAYPWMRFFTGVVLMPHGAQKLFGWFGGDPAATAEYFASLGLFFPSGLVIVVGSIEFFGGLLLAVGLLTRPVAAAIFVTMANALTLAHLDNGFFWTDGGFEYPFLLAALALGCVLRGGGELSLDRAIGREF